MCVKNALIDKGFADINVIGVVCVGCRDAACIYYTPDRFASAEILSQQHPRSHSYTSKMKGGPSRSSLSHSARVRSSGNTKSTFLSWPSITACPELYASIYSRGYTEIISTSIQQTHGVRNCSAIGVSTVDGSTTALCVIGLLGPRTSQSLQKDKNIIITETTRLWNRNKKKILTQGFILYLQKGSSQNIITENISIKHIT